MGQPQTNDYVQNELHCTFRGRRRRGWSAGPLRSITGITREQELVATIEGK